jgi:hypothetical protein
VRFDCKGFRTCERRDMCDECFGGAGSNEPGRRERLLRWELVFWPFEFVIAE